MPVRIIIIGSQLEIILLGAVINIYLLTLAFLL
jgi:hypothetical protein